MSSEPTKPSVRQGRALPVFPIVLGVIVVLALGAIVIASASGDDDDAPEAAGGETRAVTVDGDPLPELVSGSDDPALGESPPTLRGENFDGTETIIGPGDAKMVMFLAHWCPHCQAEVQRLGDWLDSNEVPDGVEIFLVPTATNSSLDNYPPSAWLEREGVSSLPTLVDDEAFDAFNAYGAGAFPYVVFVDADNEVVLRTEGEYPDDPDVYTGLVDALAAGEVPESPQTGGSSEG